MKKSKIELLEKRIIKLERLIKPKIEVKIEWGKTSEKEMTWYEAIECCKLLGEGWRLPTIEELISCIDYNKYNPASRIKGFKTNDYYWSSSTYVGSTGYAWVVGFYYGSVYNYHKTGHNYVRPVRDNKGGKIMKQSVIEKIVFNHKSDCCYEDREEMINEIMQEIIKDKIRLLKCIKNRFYPNRLTACVISVVNKEIEKLKLGG